MPQSRSAAPIPDALLDDPGRLRALVGSGLLHGEPDEHVDRWVAVAAEALGAPTAALMVVDDRSQLMVSLGADPLPDADARRLPLAQSICRHVVGGGLPLAVADTRADPVLAATGAAEGLGVVAYLGAPVRIGGQSVGSLCVAQREPRAWTEGEIRLLAKLADGLGSEIELRASAAELRRSTTIVEAHNRIHGMIAADAPVDTVLHEIVRSIEAYDPELLSSVMLLDRELGTLHPAAAPSLPPAYVALAEGFRIGPAAGSCGTAAYAGAPVIACDLLEDPHWVAYQPVVREYGLRHCWSYPILRGDGAVLGTFGVYGTAPRSPTPEHEAFIRDAARLAGIAIERRDTLDRLVHDATHDALTGLPNRAELIARLGRALARSRRSGQTLAVLFVDLDRLKIVNDTLGHEAGDQVIEQVAQRLAGAVRPGDTVARCGGGEEFLVLAEGVGAEEARRIAERLHAALTSPLAGAAHGQELTITASIGIAVVRGSEVDANEAVRRADAAMYLAKDEGGNRTRLHARVPAAAAPSRRLALESALRHAIARDELSVVFQPVHRIADGRSFSVETLVRWTHPTLGEVPPSEFIPIAEQTDLIHDIGAWVLREACAASAALEAAAGHPLLVAVNVSARQLRQRGFSRMVADILRVTGTPPMRLVVEITETALLGSDAETARTLRLLREQGVRAVLDDFGTGYSSLASLKRREIVAIKIDRSFVDGLPDDRENRAIVTALLGMAHGLGLYVVAEGIETQAQYDVLRDLGCGFGQGYLLGRPAPLATLANA